jgi:hypothetical protein
LRYEGSAGGLKSLLRRAGLPYIWAGNQPTTGILPKKDKWMRPRLRGIAPPFGQAGKPGLRALTGDDAGWVRGGLRPLPAVEVTGA